MNPLHSAVMWSVGLCIGMLACLDMGYRLGCRSSKQHSELAHEGVGAIEAAIFALLGLLLGFSFAGATSRLEVRRQLIVQEANAIGTAYLRLDLLSATDQPEMRHLLRDYVEARFRFYEKLEDPEAAEAELAHAEQLQRQIWSKATSASSADPTQSSTRLLLLPALNEMIDVTTARTIALHTHLPPLIFALLIWVALLSSLLAGFAMSKRKSRSWLHMLLYAVVVSATIYTVLDLDNPRFGWIHLSTADKALIRLRDSIR